MEQRTKQNIALINLVNDYEEGQLQGNLKFLSDKEFFQLVNYYEEENQPEKSVLVLEQAIKQLPYRAEFIILKSKYLLNFGKITEALTLLEKAESIAPFENEIKILRAKALGISGDCSDALTMIESLKLSAMGSDLADIYVCESYVHEFVKNYEQMYECLEKALHIDVKHPEAVSRFWLSVELGRRYEEGIIVYKEIIDSDPYNHLAWYHLGHACASVGEYEEAIICLEYSFIIDKHFESGYLDCADICFQLRKYDRALAYLKDVSLLFGPECDVLISMAECYIKLNAPEEAKKTLFKALKLDPYNDELFYNLAECYVIEKSWFKAINAYHKAISIEDRREEYYHGLAQTYVAIEKFDKAERYFRQAALAGCELSVYWASYVSLLIKTGKINKAEQAILESEEYTFGADLMYCEATIKIIKGERSKGLRLLEEACMEDYSLHQLIFNLQPELELDPEVKSLLKYYHPELHQ